MRIAQMLDTLNWGGAQKMQLFLVQSLLPLGIEVTVISLRQSPNSSVSAELEAAGAKVITFPFPRLFSPGSFWKLVQFLRREKFDLLQAYLTYSNIIGTLAGKLSGTPVIASLRNAGVDEKRYTSQRAAIETFVLRHLAKHVIANGYGVADFWQKRLGNLSIDVLVNSIDDISPLNEEERRALRIKLVGSSERILILSVGRLTYQKGFHDLLQAFHKIHERFPLAALIIAGEGSMYEELLSRIQKMQLQEHVFLLGVRDDVPKLLGAADIYVNSSYWEGTPVSVLEAMAAGLPIVATLVGETPHLLEAGAGILVSPGNPEVMANALFDLLGDSQKRHFLGLAALSRVRSSYNRMAWTQKLLTYYANVSPIAGTYLSRI